MSSFHPAQLQDFSLYGSGVSVGDITATLSSFQTIDGVNLTMADFGTTGYATLEPGSRDREEQVSFTGITQNSNGTATITGIKNVAFLSPYTETAGFSKSHPGGITFVISNTSGFQNQYPAKINNETITGYWGVPDPVSPTDIANREWVLSVVNGGPVSQNAVIVVGIAGETVAIGNLIYLKTSDGRWYKTNGTDATTVNGVIIGTAQGAGTAGVSITGGVLIAGIDANQSGLTTGTNYYVSNTAGAISSSAGTVSRIIGKGGTTATTLYLNPYFNTQPTDNEKLALVNLVAYSNGYAVDSGTANTYAITLSPIPSAYVAGMTVRVKITNANTGASTLNVNGLGAKTIVRNQVTALVQNDLIANQVVTLTYDGTNFELQSPVANVTQFTSGVDANHDAGNTEVITIAHGLGKVPRFTTITAIGQSNVANSNNYSYGTYDGTNIAMVYEMNAVTGSSTTQVARWIYDTVSNMSNATITVDITNITLSWTKTGTIPGSNIVRVLWTATA